MIRLALWIRCGLLLAGGIILTSNVRAQGFSRTWEISSPPPVSDPVTGCEVPEVVLLKSTNPASSLNLAGAPQRVDGLNNITFYPELVTVGPPARYHITSVTAASSWLLNGRVADVYQIRPGAESQPASSNAVDPEGDCLLQLQLDVNSLKDTPCAKGSGSWLVAHLSYSTMFLETTYPASRAVQNLYPSYPWYPLSLKIVGDGAQLGMVQDQTGDPSQLQLVVPLDKDLGRLSIIAGTTSLPVAHLGNAAKEVQLQISLTCMGPTRLAPCPMSPTTPGVDCSDRGRCVADPSNKMTVNGMTASKCECQEGFVGSRCEEAVMPLKIGATTMSAQWGQWTRYRLNAQSKAPSTLRIAADFGTYPRYTRALDGAPFLLCVQQFGPAEPVKLVALGTDVLALGKACDLVGAANGRNTQYMVIHTQPNASVYVSLIGRDRHILPGSFISPPVDGLLEASDITGRSTGRMLMMESGGAHLLPAEVVQGVLVTIVVREHEAGAGEENGLDCPSLNATAQPCGDGGICMKSDNSSTRSNSEQDLQYSWYNSQYLKYGFKTPSTYCACAPGLAGEDCSKRQLDFYYIQETADGSPYILPSFEDDLIINVVLPPLHPTYLHATFTPLACASVVIPSQQVELSLMPTETDQLQGFKLREWIKVGPKRDEPPAKLYAHYRKAMTTSIKIDQFAWQQGQDNSVDKIITFAFSWRNCAPSCWLKNPAPMSDDKRPMYGYPGVSRLSIDSSRCPSLEEALGQDYKQLPVRFQFKLSSQQCADFPKTCRERMLIFTMPWLSMAVSMGCGFILVLVGLSITMKRRYRSYQGPDGQMPGLQQGMDATQAGGPNGLPADLLNSFPTYTYKTFGSKTVDHGDKVSNTAAHVAGPDIRVHTGVIGDTRCLEEDTCVAGSGNGVQSGGTGDTRCRDGDPSMAGARNGGHIEGTVEYVGRGADTRNDTDQNAHDQNAHDQNAHDKNAHDENAHNQNDHSQNVHDENTQHQTAHNQNTHDQNDHTLNAHNQNVHDQNDHTLNAHNQNPHDQTDHTLNARNQNGLNQDAHDQDAQAQNGQDQDAKDDKVQLIPTGSWTSSAAPEHSQMAPPSSPPDATPHQTIQLSQVGSWASNPVQDHSVVNLSGTQPDIAHNQTAHSRQPGSLAANPLPEHSVVDLSSTQPDVGPHPTVHPSQSSSWVSNPVHSLSKTVHMLTSFGRGQLSTAHNRNLHTANTGVEGSMGERKEESGSNTCMICLEEYIGGDVLLQLPCNHSFHKDCVVSWLGSHTTCPACRHMLLPKAAEDMEDEDDTPSLERRPLGQGQAAAGES